MQLFHALVYDGLHEGVLHAERTAARGRRRRRTRRAAVARRPTTPRTSRVDPRRPFPRPSARDCPTNGGPPEPIDGRRAATQPTDDPAVRARRPPHRPPPRTVTAPPTRPAFLFLRAAARMPHVPMPPEPIDGRRAATQPTDDPACARRPYRPPPRPPPRTVHAPPTTPPAATHRHRAPDATPTSTHAKTRPRPFPSTRRRSACSGLAAASR